MRINHLVAASRPVGRFAGATDKRDWVIQTPIPTYTPGSSVPTAGTGQLVVVPATDHGLARRTAKQYGKGSSRGSFLT
jgi:hypothetical protein